MNQRRGAQPGNLNAARHGGKSRRFGVVLVSMARGLRAVRNGLIGLRKQWYGEAVKLHGEQLPWEVAGAIARAVDWERARQCAQRLAASKWAADPDRALALEEQAAKCGEKRDEALRLAFTPPERPDPWESLLHANGPQEPQEAATAAPAPGDPEHLAGPPDAVETQPCSTEDDRCD